MIQSTNAFYSARKQQKDHENFEFELGVAIAGDEEREVEYLQNVIENETVTKNLLGAFVPLIRELCSRSTSVRKLNPLSMLSLDFNISFLAWIREA